MKPRLDQIDRHLLALVQADGRASFADLGRALGLSAAATADRLRRLEQIGVIKGYGARVDRSALGWPFLAFVRVKADREDDESIRELVAETPEILECHQIAGDESYLMRIAARSVRHLDRVLATLGEWGGTSSSLVLTTEKDDAPLPPSDEARILER